MLSIVIPAFNERSRLPGTLQIIQKHFRGRKRRVELLVVDDGSTDGTSEHLQRGVSYLRNIPNTGKGFSVRRGMLSAKGDPILFTDADLSTPINEVEKLEWYLQKYDVVIASREKPGSVLIPAQPWWRRFPGRVFGYVMRVVLLPSIQDSQCGFKLFSRRAARDVFSKCSIDGFGFDVEALFLARKLGYKIKEVPVTWRNSRESKVSLVRDSYRMFRDVFIVRWRWLSGGYR